MPRLKNPRRVVLADLRNVNSVMRWLVGHWDQRGTVQTWERVEDPHRPGQMVSRYGRRPRRDDERVELDAREWRALAANLGDIRDTLGELQEYAFEQARALAARD